jgi:Phosphodiester glycosidase/SPOR domain
MDSNRPRRPARAAQPRAAQPRAARPRGTGHRAAVAAGTLAVAACMGGGALAQAPAAASGAGPARAVTGHPGQPRQRTAASPLGTEHWSTQAIARGVQVSTVTIANPAVTPSWTVTLEQPVTSQVTGAPAAAEVESRAWAQTTAAQLTTDGFQPRVESVAWPRYAGTPSGLMGYRVRVGSYATQAAATAEAASITAAGFTDIVEWTGYDAQQPPTLENIHVAVIDPRTFAGTVAATHDGSVAQRLTTSSVAAQLGSLVATNGGFFVTADADGVQGTQSGLGAYDGQLESMAAGDRGALLISGGGRRFQVANLTSQLTIRSGAASYAAQGINRVPGIVRDCGRPGATPTTRPEQDIDCLESSDMVLFTPAFGAALPTGPGAQVVLNSAGQVIAAGARGGSVPAGGTVLQGIGSAASWLTKFAPAGRQLHIREDVRNASTGGRVTLHRGDGIVSAAPVLVRDGRIDIDAAAEGTVDPHDLSFNYQWANVRQPRTIAGVDARGDLLLVTVDGRLAGGSEGFTLQEEAEFMRSLGAVEALNLDGGGSTAMAVNGKLVNATSDATGERPVGDTIQVLP